MNFTKISKRILPIILAVICIFFFTFHSFISGIPHEHDGSDCCLFCQLFTSNYKLSRDAHIIYTSAALLTALFIAIFIVLKNEAYSITLRTPVFLKVKLSN